MELSLLDMEKLSRKQSQILENGIKSVDLKRDKVHFRYETWVDLADFKGEPAVQISGQFNDWEVEAMQLAERTNDRA